jgi:hypothetical protein
MDDIQTPAKVAKAAEPVISAEEAERRRTHARVAIAENRIEGIQPSIAMQKIIDAYVRKEIEARDLVTVYKNGPQPC